MFLIPLINTGLKSEDRVFGFAVQKYKPVGKHFKEKNRCKKRFFNRRRFV